MINQKIRERIYKIKWLHFILVYIFHNKGYFFCKAIAKKGNYHSRLTQLRNNRNKNRCFIIGNGPSLSISDLELLMNEDCLASNGIFELFGDTAWRPKCYFLIDRYASYPPEIIEKMDVENVFLGSYYCMHNKVLRKDAFCIRERVFIGDKYRFSDDIEKYFVNSKTVSYFAMQTAVFLGYKEIYLLGFDNRYKYEKQADGSVVETGTSNAHFYKDTNPRKIVGDPIEMMKSYKSFKEYAEGHGIIVKNLTRGGNLDVFERARLEEIIEE